MKECMFKNAERNTVKGYAKFHQQTVQNNICQISLVKFKSVRSLTFEKIIYFLKFFESMSHTQSNSQKKYEKRKSGLLVLLSKGVYWYYC